MRNSDLSIAEIDLFDFLGKRSPLE